VSMISSLKSDSFQLIVVSEGVETVDGGLVVQNDFFDHCVELLQT